MKTKVRQISLEYPYSHSVTFRRSGFSKVAWEAIVHKFGVTQAEPQKIQSISIDGDDDYGRLQLSIIVEE